MRISFRAAAAVPLMLLAFTGHALASVITNSGENLRTGWYPGESSITPELVTGGTFGQEWSASVEGQVYAQPLLDNGTLVVATEQNKVYGLDPATGVAKWSKTLPHPTPWNPSDISCADLTPSIGVTGTPVIDPETNVAYMTHKTYESGSSGPARWYMDAISVATGEEQPGFPLELAGPAQNIKGLTFDATDQLQRPGLLLMEGVVYAGFGSDCDHTPYQGWVFGVSTSGTVKARWATDPDGAGIWQSGAGLTSDGPGTILLSTGNGFDLEPPIAGSKPPEALGQSVVRLQVQPGGELKAVDFFAPYDANALNVWDADFGSGGVTGLPSGGGLPFGTGAIPHLAVADGKDGYVYLLNRDNLGGYGEGPGGEDKVLQRLGPYGGVWSRPGVWPGEGGWIYIPTASGGKSAGGSSGNLDVYKYGLSAKGEPTLSQAGVSSEAFGFSSSSPIITSNGTASKSALVWVVWAPNGTGVGAQLRAYAPVPVHEEPQLLWSAPIGTSAKFAMPGVGLGRIYVGTRDGHVLGFGSPVTPALTGSATEFPTTTVETSSEKTVTLTATEHVTVTKLTSTSTQFVIGTSSPPLPATLEPGHTIKVPVTFTPTGSGPQGATLTATTSTGKTLPFSLSGTGQISGPKIEAEPKVVTFGGTTLGAKLPAAARVKNVGSKPLKITGVKSPEAPFEVEAGVTGAEIQPGHEITVGLSFDPTKYGNFEDRLTIESSGGNAPIAMTGTATTPGTLQLTPEENPYGQVPVGATKDSSFVISNTGGLPVKVNISKPPIGGAFHATSSLEEGESTIEPHESVAETVQFAPTTSGAAEGVWRIVGEDTTGEHLVRFYGEGVAPGSPAPTLVVPPPGQGLLGFQSPGPDATLASTALTASSAGTLSLRVRCPAGESTCAGTVELRTLDAIRAGNAKRARVFTLASGYFRVAGGHTATVKLHLSPLGRELLSRQHRLRLRAVIAARDPAGLRHTTTSIVTIRAARAR